MSTPDGDRKSIWLVNLFFGLGPAPTGVQLESVAQALHRAGWHVKVLTSSAGYNRAVRAAPQRFSGEVVKFYCGPWNSQGRRGRLLTWLCFYLRVGLHTLLRRPPDCVLIMTTPPFLCWWFGLRNRLARKPAALVLWNQDTYPEILDAVHLAPKTSLFYRLLERVQRRGISAVQQVVVLDEAMRELLIKQGATNVSVIPNWEISLADEESDASSPALERLRSASRRFRFRVLYTGNYGWGHDLSVLWQFLRERPAQRDCYFAFVGGGEKWPEVERLRDELSLACLDVFNYVPKSHVHALIRECDFGLVALEMAAAGLMSPSKLHGYLAHGKPVIYLGPANSNVGCALERYDCGFRVDETDARGFADLLSQLADEPFDYHELSANARSAYEQRYGEEAGVRDMLELLKAAGAAHAKN